ncbi:AAA family ATPase [uncultured Psychrobacter sp.]|uniref:AAA family ATPase n=1 Tax=uncultured Psychrobacter sp. TaxID=259303 RepID=UPI0034586956
MRLKSLKLAGFKSFANVTTFTFPRGITAIVGPNGCGKSNVIDAIRWVLGETSAKQLRGGAMSDVIFAGTQDKAAKSVASVELTFEHTQDEQTGIRHELNLYHELSIRRQVNKEGRSDYFINGTRARRRDVVDVFLGTGLGARSYAVIEQGMIGRIVDSSPMQLREFIEEAAGVSRYQARREETQKKLEATEDNLARLRDMQSELLRQQKSLSKQAANAKRYQALTESLADIQQQLAIQELYQAKAAQLEQKQQHESTSVAVAGLQSDYDALKNKQDKLSAQINQEQWLKDDAQSTHYQQQLNYQKAEHQFNDMQAKIEQIQAQLSSLAQQKSQAVTQIEQLDSEQNQQQTELASLRPELVELTAKRAAYQQDEQPLQRAWHESKDKLAKLQNDLQALEQKQALNTQAKRRYKQSYDNWQTRQQNWQTLWSQLQQPDIDGPDLTIENHEFSLSSTSVKGTELNDELKHILRRQDGVTEHLEALQPQVDRLQQRLLDEQRALTEMEKRHALLAGEYDTLHQILHPKPSSNISNKPQQPVADDENKAKNESFSDFNKLAISTLREQIELSAKGQEHAQLLDSVLHLWFDSHVLVANNLTSNIIDKTTNSGAHKDNLPADTLWQALEGDLPALLTYQNRQNGQSNTEAHYSLWLTACHDDQPRQNLDGLPDELADKVYALTQLITKPALALWQQCYLYVEDAENSADKTKHLTQILKVLPASALLLTSDGWLMSRSGVLNISKLVNTQNRQNEGQPDSQSSSQFLTQRLQQRNRLVQLEDLLNDRDNEIAAQQKTIKNSQYEFDALTISLAEARAQAEQLNRDRYQYEQQLHTQQAQHARLQADIKRLNNDKTLLEQEQQELISEEHALDSEEQRTYTAIAELTPKLVAAQSTQQQLQAKRSELANMRQADEAQWQTLQLKVQKLELRLEHTSSRLANLTQSYDQSVQNEQILITQLQRLDVQLPNLQAALQKAKLAKDEQQALLNEREAVLAQMKQGYSQQQNELDTLHTELQTAQSRGAEQATKLALSEARLEDAVKQTQAALEHYQQTLSEHSTAHAQTKPQKSSISNLLADFIAHNRRVRPDKIAELKSEQAKIEQQISKIGAVNLAAARELDEVNERLEPLTQQINDITGSMNTLIRAIADIDATTKTLFMQTLDAVNEELATLFAKVFGGGQASLTLSDDDLPAGIDANQHKSEQWRAGLTLMAQPKGKRNSRLAVLSGGEKTLTALSLIFAIFKQHPAPFCVLDEVDAPLDDANVARFTSLISDLAGDLQFIFISHNKLSMQIADELKGITMPKAGISTLVSVSLDEAADYIDA